MRNRYDRRVILPWAMALVALALPFAGSSASEEVIADKHNRVVMRMIGHELLNCWGDEKSRVLPIEYGNSQYRIPFETEFGFDPDDIISVVEGILSGASFPAHYFVEVEQCETQQMVYSFEISNFRNLGLLPCEGREMPKDCYIVVVTVLDQDLLATTGVGWRPLTQNSTMVQTSSESSVARQPLVPATTYFAVPLVLLLVGAWFYLRQKQPLETDPNLMMIGMFRFDKRAMMLSYNDQSVQLSHKEAELLSVLYESANEPLERAVLLQKVWGDEGDYVGRTLDVFISKLRKKLEADSSIKIMNIRGVGYKLVLAAPTS